MLPEITWGDTVKIIEFAPSEFRPGCLGAICGCWIKATPSAISDEQRMFTVEFGDGQTLEIPESFLAKIADDSK